MQTLTLGAPASTLSLNDLPIWTAVVFVPTATACDELCAARTVEIAHNLTKRDAWALAFATADENPDEDIGCTVWRSAGEVPHE
jgi:hypothetical protein